MRALLLSTLVLIGGCSRAAIVSSGTPAPGSSATATISDIAGSRIGTATFTDTPSGLLVSGTVSGLGLGAHGVHLHQTGKCDAPFTTAGGHFNPAARQHGFKNASGAHAGDLPNITMPAAGQHGFEFLAAGLYLSSLLDADGAAIVIHATADDYTTDPAGNSGGRIACGVITRR